MTEEFLNIFDVERIDPITILFQSGYLTIKETFTDIGRWIFRLGIPNQDVRIALTERLVNAYTESG